MNKFKVFFGVAMLVISAHSFAETKRLDLEKLLVPSSEREPSYYALLRYQNTGSKVMHNEKSESPSFVSLNKESAISIHNLGLEISKEFFNDSYFSLSFAGKFGVNKGSDSGLEEKKNLSYKEKLSGQTYGGGVSLNINTKGFGLKVQPFISSHYLISKNDYKLSYSSKTVDSINIEYSSGQKVLQHSVGVKFINNKNGLMSHFSLDYNQKLSKSLEVSGSQSSKDLSFLNMPSITQNIVTFSVGFGFIF